MPISPDPVDSDHVSSTGMAKGAVFPVLTLNYCSLARSFTGIKNRYGPYVAGAYFVLKQGGSVKYDSKGVKTGMEEARDGLRKPQALQSGRLPREAPSLCPLLAGAWSQASVWSSVTWNGSGS